MSALATLRATVATRASACALTSESDRGTDQATDMAWGKKSSRAPGRPRSERGARSPRRHVQPRRRNP
jgi:hypothetical protein